VTSDLALRLARRFSAEGRWIGLSVAAHSMDGDVRLG